VRHHHPIVVAGEPYAFGSTPRPGATVAAPSRC